MQKTTSKLFLGLLFVRFSPFRSVCGSFPDFFLGSGLPAVRRPPALSHKHLQLKETWLPGASAVSSNQIIARTGSEDLSSKAELAEAVLQMNAYNSGATTGKGGGSESQMCGGSNSQGETPGRGAVSPPDGTDRHNSLSVLQTSD